MSGFRLGIGYVLKTDRGSRGADDGWFGMVLLSGDEKPLVYVYRVEDDCPEKSIYRTKARSNDSSEPPDERPATDQAIAPDVFVCFETGGQLEWIQRHVLSGMAGRPEVVDLYRMAEYFLPHRDVFHFLDDIRKVARLKDPDRQVGRFETVLRTLQTLLSEVVAVVLSRPESDSDDHPVYSILAQALTSAFAPKDFKAVLDIVSNAYGLKWTPDLFSTQFQAPVYRFFRPNDTERLIRLMHSFLPEIEEPNGTSAREAGTEIKSIKPELIDQSFDSLFVASKRQIQPRETQRFFARFCAEAINKGGVYAVEAGTGTGKTLGYLVPACEFVLRNPGRQFLIVTATKNLQNQVVEHELPRLTEGKTIYNGIKGAVLKGKSNYLCITALAEQYGEWFGTESADPAQRLSWLYLFLRLILTEGELEGIPAGVKKRFPELADQIDECSALMACFSGLCSLGNACIYGRHLSRARRADIVVTNQHKLASLGDLLRNKVSVCLIDEADQFPENFRSSIKVELSEWRIRKRFLRRIAGVGPKVGYARILEEKMFRVQGKSNQGTELETAENILSNLRFILEKCAQVAMVLDEISRLSERNQGLECRWVRLKPAQCGYEIQAQLEIFFTHLDEMTRSWEQILKSGRYEEIDRVFDANQRESLRKEKARIEQMYDLTAGLRAEVEYVAGDYPTAGSVHVYHQNRWGWSLSRIPYDIEGPIEEVLFKSFATTLFASATLFVDDQLDLFARELCLNRAFDDVLRIPSPFDYQNNVFAAVTTFITPFQFSTGPTAREHWLDEVADNIAALTVATYGRTLVLFTSVSEMRAIYERVEPVLRSYAIEPVLQSGSSLAEIHSFRANEHSVLFGVDRFWTGVDFPGPTLSQVIIVRLPNPNLSDPMIEHRMEVQGPEFWTNYYRPVSRLKLKQGFGRLIRSEKDTGLFVILDRRILEDARMRGLQDELPIRLRAFAHKFRQDHRGDLLDLVSNGLKTSRLLQEFSSREIDIYHL